MNVMPKVQLNFKMAIQKYPTIFGTILTWNFFLTPKPFQNILNYDHQICIFISTNKIKYFCRKKLHGWA